MVDRDVCGGMGSDWRGWAWMNGEWQSVYRHGGVRHG